MKRICKNCERDIHENPLRAIDNGELEELITYQVNKGLSNKPRTCFFCSQSCFLEYIEKGD